MRRLPFLKPVVMALAIAVVGWGLEIVMHPFATVDAGLQDFVVSRRSPDAYLGSSARTAADPRQFITMIAIDDRTLSELGAYNGGYPRIYHAQLIERLLTAPPRVIAFDVGFFEQTSQDDELVAALDHARSLPVPTTIVLSAAGVNRAPVGSQGAGSFESALEPVPALADRAVVALANVSPDSRGTVRSTPLVARVGGTDRPSLGLAAVAAYLRRPSFADARSGDSLQLAGRTIPLERDGTLRVNFMGPPSRPYVPDSTFRVVSFVDVLRGRIDPAVWRGGLVFVGTLGATGLADDYWTPTSEDGRKMAGLEIHADAAATLFSTSYLRSAQPLNLLGVFFAVALVMLIAASCVSVVGSLALGPLALGAIAAVELGALFAFGQLLPVATPVAVGLSVLMATLARRVLGEQHQARVAMTELDLARSRDGITGLANRSMVLTQMRALLQKQFVLLVLDLDRFKDINETLGHSAGDAVLRALADRLSAALSDSTARIARLDGDEFAVLLPDTAAHQAALTCDALLTALEKPVEVDGHAIGVSASIGIAEYPLHGEDPETLLRHADAALQTAKQTRSGHAVYAPEQEHRAAERLNLISALRNAIPRGELCLHYQPKVDCRSGVVHGVEALVRWQHPELGLIGPDRFIPMAEQAGLIGAVTRWVLDAAVRQVQVWSETGCGLKVAVNLSAWDLQDASLSAYLRDLLERHAVSPGLLSLEITETAVVADPTRALSALSELAAYGVDASLDDFGTGYSSLTYVRQLPLRELKIDASFVRGLAEAERDRAIVSSTVELGHRLGMRVVAEGVEDANTLQLLAELGCDEAQGFYLSRPLTADALQDWVHSRARIESGRAAA